MRNGSIRNSIVMALGMVTLILIASNCKNSNSVTGPPSAPANISGAWTGTFASADQFECGDLNNTPAQASFTLDGANVVGTLNAQGGCGFTTVTFEGTIRGNTITGTITGATFWSGSTASGSVYGSSNSNLDLGLSNSFGLIPGGQMHLHR